MPHGSLMTCYIHICYSWQALCDLTQCLKKQREKDIGGESKRSEMAHFVEKVGHAFCYIHSKDTVKYPVLAWTVQVRYSVCLHTTRGSSKKTNIDPQSSLEKEKIGKRHQTKKSKKEGQVTKLQTIFFLCGRQDDKKKAPLWWYWAPLVL